MTRAPSRDYAGWALLYWRRLDHGLVKCRKRANIGQFTVVLLSSLVKDYGWLKLALFCHAKRFKEGAFFTHVTVYRPGFENLTYAFHTEFQSLLERVDRFSGPVYIAGDVNIHLEIPTNDYSHEFNGILADIGCTQLMSGATHDDGGTFDVMISRTDGGQLDVESSSSAFPIIVSFAPPPTSIHLNQCTRPSHPERGESSILMHPIRYQNVGTVRRFSSEQLHGSSTVGGMLQQHPCCTNRQTCSNHQRKAPPANVRLLF